MSNFYLDVICRDPRYLSTQRCADIELLDPRFREKVCDLIAKARDDLGISLKVWETFRSHARQIMLFNQKATKLRSVGVHHYGLAADIVKWDGEPSWRGDWAFMGTLAREFGLHWGGDWDDNSKTLNHFNDLDHVQFITTAQQQALFAGTWYP
jgi:hypothetical protein